MVAAMPEASVRESDGASNGKPSACDVLSAFRKGWHSKLKAPKEKPALVPEESPVLQDKQLLEVVNPRVPKEEPSAKPDIAAKVGELPETRAVPMYKVSLDSSSDECLEGADESLTRAAPMAEQPESLAEERHSEHADAGGSGRSHSRERSLSTAQHARSASPSPQQQSPCPSEHSMDQHPALESRSSSYRESRSSNKRTGESVCASEKSVILRPASEVGDHSDSLLSVEEDVVDHEEDTSRKKRLVKRRVKRKHKRDHKEPKDDKKEQRKAGKKKSHRRKDSEERSASSNVLPRKKARRVSQPSPSPERSEVSQSGNAQCEVATQSSRGQSASSTALPRKKARRKSQPSPSRERSEVSQSGSAQYEEAAQSLLVADTEIEQDDCSDVEHEEADEDDQDEERERKKRGKRKRKSKDKEKRKQRRAPSASASLEHKRSGVKLRSSKDVKADKKRARAASEHHTEASSGSEKVPVRDSQKPAQDDAMARLREKALQAFGLKRAAPPKQDADERSQVLKTQLKAKIQALKRHL